MPDPVRPKGCTKQGTMKLHIGSRALSLSVALGMVLAAVQLSSCSDAIETPSQQPGSAAPNPAPTTTDFTMQSGSYGGENIEMKVTDSGTDFNFGCADGKITGKIEPDSTGAFEAPGTYRSTAGPVPDGGYITSAARYEGTVNRGIVRLTVSYTEGDRAEQLVVRDAALGQDSHFTIICATSTGGGT